MATKLLAPSMGEGVEEVTIINWIKKEGDQINELDEVVELETDKVTTEIPSPVGGTILKILAQNGETVKVGSTLAWIGKPGEVIESSTTEKKEVKTSAPAESVNTPLPQPTQIQQEYTGRISPLVKKIAAAENVDLNLVQGTGINGRITKEDIINYIELKKKTPQDITSPLKGSSPEPKTSTTTSAAGGVLIPHSILRKQIAERMVNSKHTSPHVLTVMEADLTKVLAHRNANKEGFANQGVNLTLTAYFCAAIVNALKANPIVNSSWTEEGIQIYNAINLGVATSLGVDGLIVPVIKDAGTLSLLGLAKSINDLSTRARTKKLLPNEVKEGTFTLTNHGSGESLFAMPVIFQPQAAILGTGRMQKRVVVITDATGNDAISIRPMIYLSLVFDHRILDGAAADQFLKAVKLSLENWSTDTN